MKKIIAVICAVALSVSLCACATMEYENPNPSTSMFVCLESATNWDVVYHKETKVMYVVSNGVYSHGNFTMLVNADGTPQIYKGE